MKSVTIVGAGFAGLSAACCLAKEGFKVTVIEKNEQAGGRASVYSDQGFMFDMGPSWYWMPDVFEHFFSLFDKNVKDYYDLIRLDPSYRIYWEKHAFTDVPASAEDLGLLFESWEKGAYHKFQKFLKESKIKYEKGMDDLVYKPSLSLFEFVDPSLIPSLVSLQLFSSLQSEVRKNFKDSRIQKILEFPVYFLGALPENTPALYSLMNYADLVLGTWYPAGGMGMIPKAMKQLALDLGVTFEFNTALETVLIQGNVITSLYGGGGVWSSDYVIAACDYHHFEQKLIPATHRQYSEEYWNSRVMAPSSLIYYLGIEGEIPELKHHNLFFHSSFEQFGQEIYTTPKWPEDPLFYVCCPSKTDKTVAPPGCENLFVLVPVATGLKDDADIQERYFQLVLNNLKNICGIDLSNRIITKRCFAGSDFISRYNAFKGNAYGLANTLMQTAILKPSLKNSKVQNLYYTGQLTVPGPGVPPAIISGQIVAAEILKENGIHKDYSPKAHRVNKSKKVALLKDS